MSGAVKGAGKISVTKAKLLASWSLESGGGDGQCPHEATRL